MAVPLGTHASYRPDKLFGMYVGKTKETENY